MALPDFSSLSLHQLNELLEDEHKLNNMADEVGGRPAGRQEESGR